jgi:hypothetical protein
VFRFQPLECFKLGTLRRPAATLGALNCPFLGEWPAVNDRRVWLRPEITVEVRAFPQRPGLGCVTQHSVELCPPLSSPSDDRRTSRYGQVRQPFGNGAVSLRLNGSTRQRAIRWQSRATWPVRRSPNVAIDSACSQPAERSIRKSDWC